MLTFRDMREQLGQKFGSIAGNYFEDSRHYIHAIERSIEIEDGDGIVENAHPLKSSSSALGFNLMATIAALIEHTARHALNEHSPITGYEASFLALKDAFEKTESAYALYMRQAA